MKNSVKIVLCMFLLLVLVWGVQAAETYQFVTKWGTAGTGDGQFNNPTAIDIDTQGNFYVVDGFNNRVQKFSPKGEFVTKWGSKGSGNGQFDQPVGLAVDSHNNVYVTDEFNSRVQKFSSTGQYITQWGGYGSADGQFSYPIGIAIDGADNVYVSEIYNMSLAGYRVQKFSPSGQFITKWFITSPINLNPNIWGICTDNQGNVLVSEFTSHQIEKFSPSGQSLSLLGDRSKIPPDLYGPNGCDIDSSGNIFVAQSGNIGYQFVKKLSPQGNILTTIGGGIGNIGSADGEYTAPMDVVVDSTGNVYVVDRDNNRIQKFAPVSPSAYNFTGSWTMGGTDGVWGFGSCMALRQSGTQVLGNYTHELGIVTGTVSGNTLSGVWAEEPTYTGDKDSGKFVVTMSTDGNSFSGTWGYGSSSTGYSFTGTRTSTVCPVPTPTGLSVTGITPSTAPNSGPVGIIDLSGSGFTQTVSVKLTKWGSQTITASGITVVSQSKITCNFDLTGKDAGTWDVVVTKPDGQSATLPNGFTVTAQSGTSLAITSDPPGADLFIDGIQRGTTPATFTDVLPGAHAIAIAKLGYYGYYSDISVTAGQPATVDVTLQHLEPGGTGSISITSTPKDTAVYLDGNYKGLGLTVLSEVGPGYHSLKLTKSGYNDFGKDVFVRSGETTAVVAVLQPVVIDGSISASSTPTGAAVYLDGDYKGLTPTQISSVKPGSHVVSFTKNGYSQISQSVTVSAGEKKTVAVNLISKKECWVDLGVVCLPGFESMIAIIALLSVVAIIRRK